MSLTKEATELRDLIESGITQPDRCTTHHFACHCMNRRTVDIIDRLSARVEKLEKDRLAIYGQLSTLLEAVEPVLLASKYSCKDEPYYMNIKVEKEDLRRLDEAVKKVRGEK